VIWVLRRGEIELTDATPTGTDVRIRLPLAYRETEPTGTADEVAGD